MRSANKVDCSKIEKAILQPRRDNRSHLLWVNLRFLLELSGELNRDFERYENYMIQLP